MRYWQETDPRWYTDDELVNEWVDMHRKNWFENRENGLYGYEQRAHGVAEYWLKNGKHVFDLNDPSIIYLQNSWDKYLEMFKEIRR